MRRYVGLCAAGAAVAALAGMGAAGPPGARAAAQPPIRHVVVIYLENHSFDSVLGFWCDVHPARCPDGGMPAKVKLSNGAGTFSPLRPIHNPATGAIKSGLVSKALETLAPVDQKLALFFRSISTTTKAKRNKIQAVNSVAIIEAGALSGPNTRRHIGIPMNPTLL